MNDGDCPTDPSTALIPLQTRPRGLCADPELQERIERAAAASGSPPPYLVPGAAALILPVSLPLKTDRQRRTALPFAAEPHLAEPLDQVVLTLGPHIAEQTWVCIAMNRDRLNELTMDRAEGRAVIPDTLCVPLPARSDAWALWCGRYDLHIRLADGTGLSVARDEFVEFWRAFGAPPVEILHGTPPPGVRGHHVAPPPVDPALFKVTLMPGRPAGAFGRLRGLSRIAASVAVAAGLAHISLIHLDATFLANVVQERSAAVQRELDARGIDLAATDPVRLVEAAIVSAGGEGARQDPFLAQLARTLAALPPGGAVSLRDLRFDAGSSSLSILLTADDLQHLQSAETALLDAGISVTSGAATRSDVGAELQLIIAGGA